MLFTTAGFHVPVMPLLEVVGRIGGTDPAQKCAILKKAGVKTGSERINPVFRKVGHPLMSSWKSEYTPLFKPLITILPVPSAV
jgi:hypothetical protein